MTLSPFGVLNDGHKGLLTGGLHRPMRAWRGTPEDFQTLMEVWLDEVATHLWPAWTGAGWAGAAAAGMVEATRRELLCAVTLYHGGGGRPDILDALPPGVPVAPDGRPRSHRWHYEIEDARVLDRRYQYCLPPEGEEPSLDFRASRTIGSNYLIYEPGVAIREFEHLFWGQMEDLQPAIFDIKLHFQRPRPWTAAAALGIEGFRWITADGITHTGVHPSLLSGHCIQGVLGVCAVFDTLLDRVAATGAGLSDPRIRALQAYMVDWGDRRVFAGVHYMTDNIASWTLARRLIPHLFRNAPEVEAFAVTAITGRSRVFQDIRQHFPASDPARQMLERAFPEAPATVQPAP